MKNLLFKIGFTLVIVGLLLIMFGILFRYWPLATIGAVTSFVSLFIMLLTDIWTN